jgi:hypothetical protein
MNKNVNYEHDRTSANVWRLRYRIESIRRYRVPISTAPALECRQQAIGCTVPGSTCERAAQRCISVGVPRGRLPVTRPFGVRRSKRDLHTNMAHVKLREEAAIPYIGLTYYTAYSRRSSTTEVQKFAFTSLADVGNIDNGDREVPHAAIHRIGEACN